MDKLTPEQLEFAREQIESYGMVCLYNLERDTVIGPKPPYMCTAGLGHKDWPEIFVSGKMMPEGLETMIRRLVERWNTLGTPQVGFIKNLFKRNDDSFHHAQVRYIDPNILVNDYMPHIGDLVPGAQERRAVQLFWPDMKGRFPLDEEFTVMPSYYQEVLPAATNF